MIGTTVGNYRIDARIGAGGMGAVYLAEHLLIGRKTAVKVLLPQLSGNPELVSRFFNEARSTAMIRHPGLVEVFDFGHLPDGSAYIVMEYLEGETLARRLEREEVFPLAMVWSVGRQIASAVHAAHCKRIVHRDLKPDNVFLLPDPEQPQGVRVKVLDFGIAKLTEDETGQTNSMTRTGAVMGTPTYMSPEQCRGAGQVDRRADIYSLGCMLYEMVCGQPPFVREGVGELIAAHITESPPLPSSLEASVSPTLESMILDMLAKDPAARPQTMEAVKQGLDNLVTGMPVSVTPAHGVMPGDQWGAPLGPATDPASPTPLEGERPLSPGRRSGLILGVAAVVLLGIGLVVFLLLRPFGTGSQASSSKAHSQAPRGMAAAASPRGPPEPREPPARRMAAAPKVRIAVLSDPEGAEVYRAADGLLVGRTPFHQEEEASSGRAVFLVKLPGHRDERVELPADKSGEVRLKLVPLAARPGASPPALRPRPGPRDRVAPREREAPMPPPERRPAMRPVRDGVADPFGD